MIFTGDEVKSGPFFLYLLPYSLPAKYYETGSFVNYHITMSPDGGFIISASWPYEVRLIRIGADGEKVWKKTISSERYEDKNPTIIETDSSDFMIAGNRTLGPESNYQRVVALIRINSDGEIETEKNIVEETHLPQSCNQPIHG